MYREAAAIAQATSSWNTWSRGLTGSHVTSAPYDGHRR